MSKSYQYYAKKRGSHRYFDVSTPCTNKQSHNHITCKYCLWFTGETRRKQQEFDKSKQQESSK